MVEENAEVGSAQLVCGTEVGDLKRVGEMLVKDGIYEECVGGKFMGKVKS
jgi:hypothetical protein